MRFACIPGCTACCRERGFVYLTEADVESAAAHLGMSPAEFEARYLYLTAHLRRLRKPRRAQCPFLTETGCRLHPAKPTQCRSFPFWPEILDDPAERRAVRAYCPGIGRGALVSIQTDRQAAEAMRRAYPRMYC